MKIIKGTDKGFFALCNDTARHISNCIKNNEEWFVDWGSETLYYDASRGKNVWEYYFNQTYKRGEGVIVKDYTELALIKQGSFRSTMNYIYSNFFKLNDNIYEKLSISFKLFAEKKILGVHIRRTDKFLIGMYGTTQKHAPVDLQLFKEEIDNVLHNYDFIYLATDCIDAIEYMKKHYGKKLIFNINAIRGSGTQSIHNNFKNISGYVKGLNVLTDTILLSKCKHLIRSSSNVSITSLYLNPDLTHLNVNEKYYNDTERDLL